MLEYYTGFDLAAVELLTKRFEEVCLPRPFFLFCHSALVRVSAHLSVLLTDALSQVIKLDVPKKRSSNSGSRNVPLTDRVVMFLSRMRRKVTSKELGYQNGCGEETAARHCTQMLDIFHKHFVPRLVYPRSPEELRKMSRPEVLARFPDLLAILDATNWPIQKPENFLKNRLSYSAYKHENVVQVLFGK